MENERRKLKAPIGSFLLWLFGAFQIVKPIINLRYMGFPGFITLCSGILLILLGIFSLKNNNKLLLYISIAYSVCELVDLIFNGVHFLLYSPQDLNLFYYLSSVFMILGYFVKTLIIAAQMIPILKPIKDIGKKLKYYLAGIFIISIIALIIGIIVRIIVKYKYIVFGEIIVVLELVLISSVVPCGVLFVVDRVIDPYENKPLPADSEVYDIDEYIEIYCPVVRHVLLCLFSFGIWYLIWIFKSTKYLNRSSQGEKSDPTKSLLLCIFIPFYSIYWFYVSGQKLESMMKERKLAENNIATLCLVLGIFLPLVACFIMQDKFNQLCTAPKGSVEKEALDSGAESFNEEKPVQAEAKETETITALKSYKELLDSGVITQEEFDAKKQQLLGL